MKIEILGSGGAVTIPRPGCACRVCEQARQRGLPYRRSGPSYYLHEAKLLIDTPEEIVEQLNRSGIMEVRACIYSHWHPDHVMGRRVWEMNVDWLHLPPQHRQTQIYLPQRVAEDFHRMLGTWDHLKYFERWGVVQIHTLQDGQEALLGNLRVKPFRLAQEYVYAFLIEAGEKRALIAPDEVNGWLPPDEMRGLDLAILPKGIAEFNPLTGARHIPADHPILKMEATFEEVITIVRQLEAKRVVMAHIEELDRLSHDDLKEVEKRLAEQGLRVEFGYDQMLIEL